MTNEVLTGARRVVTGVNAVGKSGVQFDTHKQDVQSIPELAGFRWLDLWGADLPAANNAKHDLAEGLPIFPEKNATIFRIFEIDPDSDDVKEANLRGATHPGMNAAGTLDFIYVIEGEAFVVFEDGETHLKKGDYFIQQGTRHAWSNRSNKPVRMLAVLVGGELGS